jgi:hypothetical protein
VAHYLIWKIERIPLYKIVEGAVGDAVDGGRRIHWAASSRFIAANGRASNA